jgi:hypothetical protein
MVVGLPVDVDLGPLPDSPAGRRLAWVVQELNLGGLSKAQIESTFTPELLDGFPADRLSTALVALSREIAPLNVDRVVGTAEPHRVTAAVLSRGADWYTLKITTQAEEPFLIAGIFYEADPSLAPPPPSDWAKFGTEVAKIAPRVSFLAAEVTDRCVPVAELDASAQKPIASAFKLYVLSALVASIGASAHAWNEILPIADPQKSLPSGFLHLRTAGSTLSIQQHAEAMIFDSDNTATDHLIHLLGRSAIEEAFATAGHAEPARNRPLMTTREWFLLKLHLDDAGRAAYLAKDEAGRRGYLDGDLAGLDLFTTAGDAWRAWKAPLPTIDTIEWFASHGDLCRVMLRLRDQMSTTEGAPVRAILSKNTVFTVDGTKWRYAGFKGGFEPGLLSVTWLLQRSDMRWFVVSVTASDLERKVAQGSVVRQARNAIDLLATH